MIERKIIFRDGYWCVMSSDGRHILSRHSTLDSAKQWKRTRRLSQFKASADGSQVRSETFRGKAHVVFPVIALVEGVIHASNSETPELVLAKEFSKAPKGWNGRPVMMDHPVVDGQQTSANSPEVLEQFCVGYVFNAEVDGDKLKMEAWLDPDMVKEAQAEQTMERILAGETVEVSVGVFVQTEAQRGEYQGKKYSAVWKDITPDHLALLPEGVQGACSVEMGCGAPRAASKGGEKMKLSDTIKALRDKLRSALETGDSDVELRDKLDRALFSMIPAFLSVVAVYPDSGQVVYAAINEDESVTYYRRGYSVEADGEVKFSDDVETVEMVTEFQPAQTGSKETKTAAGSGCGCGGKHAANKEEKIMACPTKKPLIDKILSRKKPVFTETDRAALESFSVERLTALAEAPEEVEPKKEETPAPTTPAPVAPVNEEKKDEELTEEKALAKFPRIASIVRTAEAVEKARRAELITAMGKQTVYSKDELEKMTTEQLEKTVQLAGLSAGDGVKLIDNAGRGLPKTGSEAEIPAAPDIKERILARRGGKSA